MDPKPDFILTVEEYDALTRADFWIFVQRVFAEVTGETFDDNWHIQLLCSEIDRIRTEPNTLLAVALPPRSLKSVILSVALPAWLLGHNPGTHIVCASYAQELTDQPAADCRRVMLAPWYCRLFPQTRLKKQALGHLVTTRGGKRYSTSVEGSLTGIGADVTIVDDPMKPEEAASDAVRQKCNDWARHTLFTRTNRKSDLRIVVVQQRLHEEDMIGMVMQIPGFRLLSFPAIAQEDELHVIRTPFGTLEHARMEGEALHPERESLEVLARQRTLLGTSYFSAQYLQSPSPPGGNLVNPVWFGRYHPQELRRFTRIVQSWDCASKASQLSDYSVCTTWGVTHDRQIWLLHVFREKLEYRDLKRKIRELSNAYKAGTVLIEDAAAGIQLVQELRLEGFTRIVPIRPLGDKVMRMANQTALIETGKVYVPDHAPWLEAYLHELMMFPRTRYDDQVDSTSQALGWIGMPNDAEQWFINMREVELRRVGLTAADLQITFEHPAPDRTFIGHGGRVISRDADGFWHCTATEWAVVCTLSDITLFEDNRN